MRIGIGVRAVCAVVLGLVGLVGMPVRVSAQVVVPAVHFVVDRSGSMGGGPLESAKAAVAETAGILPVDTALGLRSFASTSGCASGGTLGVSVGTGRADEVQIAVSPLHGPTGLAGVGFAGVVYPSLRDHQGSPTNYGAPAGTAASFDPYGTPTAPYASAVPTAIGYHGERTLDPNGQPLVDLRARVYDPTLGMFLTPDPVEGNTGTTTFANTFHYTNNNPINLTDPTGLRPLLEKFLTSDWSTGWGSTDCNQMAGAALRACALYQLFLVDATVCKKLDASVEWEIVCETVRRDNLEADLARASGQIQQLVQAYEQVQLLALSFAVPGAGAGLTMAQLAEDLDDGELNASDAIDFLTVIAGGKAFRPATKAGLGESCAVGPSRIRFSQDSVSATFRDGSSVDDLVSGLRSGAVDSASVPPIRVFEQGGEWFTLDNRRLLAFQEGGCGHPVCAGNA